MLLVRVSQWFTKATKPKYTYASVSVRPDNQGEYIIDFEKGKGGSTTLALQLTRFELVALRDEIQLALKS